MSGPYSGACATLCHKCHKAFGQREFTNGEAPTDPSARRETFQKLLMKECGAEYDDGIDAELGSAARLRWLHAGIFVGNLFGSFEGLVPDSVMHTYAKKLIAASEGREGSRCTR